MGFNIYSSFYSIISLIVGMFLLIYFWLPLFIILGFGIICYIIFSLITAKLMGKNPNINVRVVKIKRYYDPNQQSPPQQEHIDYIDSTTADKENNTEEK